MLFFRFVPSFSITIILDVNGEEDQTNLVGSLWITFFIEIYIITYC